jgi:hypothetical protein
MRRSSGNTMGCGLCPFLTSRGGHLRHQRGVVRCVCSGPLTCTNVPAHSGELHVSSARSTSHLPDHGLQPRRLLHDALPHKFFDFEDHSSIVVRVTRSHSHTILAAGQNVLISFPSRPAQTEGTNSDRRSSSNFSVATNWETRGFREPLGAGVPTQYQPYSFNGQQY